MFVLTEPVNCIVFQTFLLELFIAQAYWNSHQFGLKLDRVALKKVIKRKKFHSFCEGHRPPLPPLQKNWPSLFLVALHQQPPPVIVKSSVIFSIKSSKFSFFFFSFFYFFHNFIFSVVLNVWCFVLLFCNFYFIICETDKFFNHQIYLLFC